MLQRAVLSAKGPSRRTSAANAIASYGSCFLAHATRRFKNTRAFAVYDESKVQSRFALILFLLCTTSVNAQQFSIKCPFQTFYFVTFDTDTGRVVHESPAGSAMKGRIDKAEGDNIHFHLLKAGEHDFELIWDPSQKKLTWLDVPGDRTRRKVSSQCEKTELRSILSKYDNIAPY